ncbi:hypothetical protein J6590_082615 [Homalodisca vitripennis]|nr:hypothetical protein J6590_082615 [Homalodisca vitripennis]
MKLTVLLCCLAAVLYTVSAFPTDAMVHNLHLSITTKVSDPSVNSALDSSLGWGGYDNPRQSKIRALLHSAYHEIQYRRTGNQREHERAKDQWGIIDDGPRDNLDRYDREHYGTGKQQKNFSFLTGPVHLLVETPRLDWLPLSLQRAGSERITVARPAD